MFKATVLKDSVSHHNVRLTTLEVIMPRIVLAELNTHRMFSRNSASSRAIPIEKRITGVVTDPFVPEQFGKNQPGMVAQETVAESDAELARQIWLEARDCAVSSARKLAALGVHKQLANRLIEPFCWHTVVLSATDWDNFFALRCNPNAQPEMRRVAETIREAMNDSSPVKLMPGTWHLPYVDDETQLRDLNYSTQDIKMISAGRCARVSYMTHGGARDPQADIELSKKLMDNGHMSPFEHVARPVTEHDVVSWGVNAGKPYFGNFCGWVQFRKEIKNEDNYAKIVR